MLDELLEHPGVEELCELHGPFGFIAPHGGWLEAMTDTIAREAATRSEASLYAIRQPRGFRWHIPSNRIDPDASDRLRAFVEHVDVAIAVHGWGADALFVNRGHREYGPLRDHPVLCGGRNRTLARAVAEAIRERLPDYEVVDDLDSMPRRLRGLHAANIVNAPRGAGVQLELPPRIRGLPPHWPDGSRGPRCPDVLALVDALAGVARAWCASQSCEEGR